MQYMVRLHSKAQKKSPPNTFINIKMLALRPQCRYIRSNCVLSKHQRTTEKKKTHKTGQTYQHVPVALYSLLNVAPDDGLMIVRNM